MMGKLQATSIPTLDTKEVIITDSKTCEPPDIRVVRINTHADAPMVFDEDKAIASSKKDNDKRRTVKLDRVKASTSWGFTLQSYGIYNSTARCIENYTYVDYVELKSPSFKSGMRRGDIIFAVDGRSTEDLSHDELVEEIQTCKNSMRLVLVNSNICQKVELHQRRQKLQAVLRQKQSELKSLANREAALLFNVRARTREHQLRRLKVQARDGGETPASNQQETTFTTENNNTKSCFKSPAPSPSVSTCSRSPVPSSLPYPKSSGPRTSTSSKSPNPGPSTTRRWGDVRPKLSPYMSKLALSDEPTAYERTLLSQARQQSGPSSPVEAKSSTMQRRSKSTIPANGTQSLRLARFPQGKVS